MTYQITFDLSHLTNPDGAPTPEQWRRFGALLVLFVEKHHRSPQDDAAVMGYARRMVAAKSARAAEMNLQRLEAAVVHGQVVAL